MSVLSRIGNLAVFKEYYICGFEKKDILDIDSLSREEITYILDHSPGDEKRSPSGAVKKSAHPSG